MNGHPDSPAADETEDVESEAATEQSAAAVDDAATRSDPQAMQTELQAKVDNRHHANGL